MKRFWLILALAVGLLLLTACTGESGDDAAKTEDAAEATAVASVPDSGSFPYMGEAELTKYLKDNAGRPTMLFFWATWCPSCKQEIPELEAFQKTHGDKVNIIALSVDDNLQALEKYAAKHPMDLSVYWGGQELARNYQVEAIPTLVIFDKTGRKIFAQAGVFPQSMLGAMADKLNQ